jgi:hypothetical protein
MPDDEMEEIIHRYVYDKMSEDEMLDFAEHLAECESCDKKVDKALELSKKMKLYFLNDPNVKIVEPGKSPFFEHGTSGTPPKKFKIIGKGRDGQVIMTQSKSDGEQISKKE